MQYNRVRQLRLELDLTLTAFAESVGIGEQYQWRVEHRRDMYSFARARRIEKRYGAKMAELGITIYDLMAARLPKFVESRREWNATQRQRRAAGH